MQSGNVKVDGTLKAVFLLLGFRFYVVFLLAEEWEMFLVRYRHK